MRGLKNAPEVNTGRQLELDDAKGFLMLAIMLIHSFQVLGNVAAKTGAVYEIVFGIFRITGAGLYLFSMGFGMAYTKKNAPKDLAKSGMKHLLDQVCSNLIYVACIGIPYFISTLFLSYSEESIAGVRAYAMGMLFFVNIFFIAGMISLLMAVLKKMKAPLWVYGVVGLTAAILTPFLAKVTVKNAVASVLLDMAFGSTGKVSFCFFPYISFVCSGYIFGMIMRKIGDKSAFYKKGSVYAGAVLVIAAVLFFRKYPSLDEQFATLGHSYIYPGILKLIVADAAIFLMLAFLYFSRSILEQWKWMITKIRFIAKHISKYYAIHVGVYLVFCVFFRYEGIGTAGCILTSVPATLITDAIVKWYVARKQR